VAEYLGIGDLVSLNQIFHPNLASLNKLYHSLTLKALSEHSKYLALQDAASNFLPQSFFLDTNLEASRVIASYPLEDFNLDGGIKSIFKNQELLPGDFFIKCAETIVDAIALAKSPSYENFRNIVVDANHLCAIYYGSEVYYFVVIAANILQQASQGNLWEATKLAATSTVFLSTSQFTMKYKLISDIAYGATTLFKVTNLIERANDVVFNHMFDIPPPEFEDIIVDFTGGLNDCSDLADYGSSPIRLSDFENQLL
jgi:hypothetical protein